MELYRQQLLSKEQELIAAITRFEMDGRATGEDDTQDRADKATQSYNKEALFLQSSQERALLAQVQIALRGAEEGDYGICAECGKPVEEKRLEAVPWAQHCARCKELQERGLL